MSAPFIIFFSRVFQAYGAFIGVLLQPTPAKPPSPTTTQHLLLQPLKPTPFVLLPFPLSYQESVYNKPGEVIYIYIVWKDVLRKDPNQLLEITEMVTTGMTHKLQPKDSTWASNYYDTSSWNPDQLLLLQVQNTSDEMPPWCNRWLTSSTITQHP